MIGGSYLLIFFVVIRRKVFIADFFFFFQAEDGIRDVAVTGVQTCALPISAWGCLWRRPGAVRPVRQAAASHPPLGKTARPLEFCCRQGKPSIRSVHNRPPLGPCGLWRRARLSRLPNESRRRSRPRHTHRMDREFIPD